MAKLQILWTVLPNGIDKEGNRLVSVVVSPRLTPENVQEEYLKSFQEFINWPETLNLANFTANISGKSVKMRLVSQPDPKLWSKIFTEKTRVDGFEYLDMSKVNLNSYPVRGVLSFLKFIYSYMATSSPLDYPSLLPLSLSPGGLRHILVAAGTVIQKDNSVSQAFDRFFDDEFNPPKFSLMGRVPEAVVNDGDNPKYNEVELQVVDQNWETHGSFASETEFYLYQADRFYRRTPPTQEERMKKRPDFVNVPEPPEEPDFDFHEIIAALADIPQLMRHLGLVLDFVLDESSSSDKTDSTRPSSSKTPSITTPRDTPNFAPFDKLTQRDIKGYINLEIKWRTPASSYKEDVTPKTAFLYTNGLFITRPRSEEIKNGLLNLEKANDKYDTDKALFDIYQVDPDGAALKTINFLLTAQSMLSNSLTNSILPRGVTHTTGNKQGLAALRTGGLGISRNKRALDVAANAAAATAKNHYVTTGRGSEVTLYAEDLLQGYRVDVAAVRNEDTPGTWRSLNARVGEYQLVETATNAVNRSEPLPLDPDEGYVSGPSTTSGGPDSDSPDDHYLHESMFRWTGWSLAVPHPGRIIKSEEASDSNIQTETVVSEDEAAELAKKGTGVVASFKAPPGTLPRLRFGQLYRIRARVVDLAGNSLAFDDPSLGDFTGASEAVGFWRFEPVDPPVIVHRSKVSEGESLERMVIRSNYDVGTAGYLEWGPFSDAIKEEPSLSDFSYNAVNERHFVPPKSSQQQSEAHGLFDQYVGDWERIRKGYSIAARDEMTLNEAANYNDNLADIEFVTPSSLHEIATTTDEAPKLPSEDNPLGDRMAGGQYVIHKEEQIITPYLPDGASEGTAIRAIEGHDLPGVSSEMILGPSCEIKKIPIDDSQKDIFVILIKHQGVWPDLQGFRLILAEERARRPNEYMFYDFPPIWDESKRTLTLFVKKGWVVRLRYSSYSRKDIMEGFGIVNWIDDIVNWIDDVDKRNYAKELAYAYGANWLLTPFRDLTLVHATQQPLRLPEFYGGLRLIREPGSHDVTFQNDTTVILHGPSTGKFEVEANWTEWVDDITRDAPELVAFKGQLGEIALPENYNMNPILADVIREQQYEVNSNSENTKKGNVHQLGDTKARVIKYSIRATSRFTEYFPASINDEPEYISRVGPVATGPYVLIPTHNPNRPDPGAPILPNPRGTNEQSLVPASAAPADPKVLYIVPTMQWSGKIQTRDGYNETRTGNGLRVWLDRPWFSSGDGELLGVVVLPDNQDFTTDADTSNPNAYENLVSQWGPDPFWRSSTAPKTASPADFPARVTSEVLRLQESNRNAMIIGHRVHYDYDRKLWYCDISFSNEMLTYMPFVKLALVRYQPNALPNAKISKVVMTDFIQILPIRLIDVFKSRTSVEVLVRGNAPISGPLSAEDANIAVHPSKPVGSGRNRFELVMQQMDAHINSDLAWSDLYVVDSKIVQSENINNIINYTAGIAQQQNVPMRADRRLMIREFEQYYSDDVVSTTKQRVIEERLVFSYVIDL